ncbi:MAG: chemotaxis protein CheW [Candidatus Aenigmarchaeota archaeon]|nr:chemotaxis protein CheW [Candidatus Aenigmarchaeota archaeon]
MDRLEKTETLTLVAFHLGSFLFGIPAEKVVEINKDSEVTPVPLAEDYVLGIMNLRGQILTVIDLAKKLELKTQVQPRLNLIIKAEEETSVSFVIERIEDILKVPLSKLTLPPERVEGLKKEHVDKVYQLSDRLLLLLKVEKLFES